MEPEGSLPHLQVPASCPCPESDQPVHAPTPILKIHLNIILPSMPVSYKYLFLSVFPIKTLYALLLAPIHATYSAHLIILNKITPK